MKWYEFIFIFIVLLGAVNTAYQIFQMTKMDAESRGLKHPRLWGILATGGQNGGGLLVYLLSRRKYPSHLTKKQKQIMNSRKLRAGVGLIFMVSGAFFLILSLTLWSS